MSIEPVGAHAARIDEEPGLHHETHHAGGYSSATGNIGEKAFIWIAWALAAAFIGFTMSLYFPGFLNA